MEYGKADNTYQAAGCEEGIRQLVDHFYDIMQTDYRLIWRLHPSENNQSRDKLARFLCAWTGGPRLYNEKYGPINIPKVHAHLAVTTTERDQWLACMTQALNQMDFPASLKTYLITQLAIPAERIRQTSAGSEA
jgi:hemoglobin